MQLLKKPKQTTKKPKTTKSPRKLEGENSYEVVYKGRGKKNANV